MNTSELISDPGFPYLAAGVLMFPNVLFQLIPIFRGRNTAAFWSFFFSLVINCGYGFLFGDYEMHQYGVYLLGFAALFTVIPYSYCCCSTSFQGNHLAMREIFSKQRSRTDFIREMCGNRALPPCISVWCEAYHYRTRVVRTKNGTSTRREKVVTYRAKRALRYSTWEEKGNSIRMKETDVIHAVCTVHYKLDDSAKSALSDLRHTMYRLALSHDVYASVGNSFFVPGLKESVVGTLNEEKDCVMSFYQTGWGRLFWIIFLVLGYQSAYESIWCQKGERMKLRLKKAISCNNQYHCTYGNEDGEAARDTFRFESGTVIIDPSILSNFYRGKEDEELYQPYPEVPQQPGMQPYIPNMGPQQPGMQPGMQPYPQNMQPGMQPYPQNIQPGMQPYPQNMPPMQPGMPNYGAPGVIPQQPYMSSNVVSSPPPNESAPTIPGEQK